MRANRHGLTTLPHELLCDAQAAVGAHDAQAGDVAVLDAVAGLLLHLGQDVADDLGVVIGALLGTCYVDGDEAELRP